MKRTRLLMALMLLSTLLGLLAACTPGDLGGEEIAFVRDGNLWTINPNGANAFEAVDAMSQGAPIVGYGLSPDHRMLVFRTLDGAFAKTLVGAHLSGDPVTGLVGDAPASLSVVGIDGGSPIPLISSTPTFARSNAWWSPDSNRLLYREASVSALSLATWVVSQNDQPVGIARKFLPVSFSIPSMGGNSLMAIGNSSQGVFMTTLAGTELTFVQRGALPGHPLSASLERVLWQPVQARPDLLYALPVGAQTPDQELFALFLREANGQTRLLARCACRQFAWSPDGNQVLYSTAQGYTVLNIQNGTSFTFGAEPGAVPYWSPDSRALLLDGQHTLTLVYVVKRRTQLLLSDGQSPATTVGPLAAITAFLQPVENSLWNSNSRHLVLITRGRTLWQGQSLRSGDGLYVVDLNEQGEPQGLPTLVDNNGHDTQPGWSYEDPNTSFLF